jgi:hypothetical protein
MRFTVIGSANDFLPHINIDKLTFKNISSTDEDENNNNFDKPPSYDWKDEELSNTPKWVQNNLKLGRYGEIITENFLNDQGVNVSKKGDRKGYDLENIKNGITSGYEVKTASKSLSFFISANELITANEMKDNYNIFFIFIHQEEQAIDGYLIDNPVKTLNLPTEIMLGRQHDLVIVSNASYKIVLSIETLSKFKRFNLTPWGVDKY